MRTIFATIKMDFYFSTKKNVKIEDIGCMIVHYFTKHWRFKGFEIETLGTNHDEHIIFYPSKFHEASFEAIVTINADEDVIMDDIIKGITTKTKLSKLGNKNIKFKGILIKGFEITDSK